MGTMANALVTQGRVIFALMMREVYATYGRTHLGYIWALIDSMVHIMVFYCIRSVRGFEPPHGMPLLYLLVFGFCLFAIFRGTATKCMGAVSANKALLTFPQITPLDLMLARMIVLWGKEITVGLILITVGLFCGLHLHIKNFSSLVFVLLYAPLLGLGIGLILHTFKVLFPVTERIVPLVLRAMFFASGVFYSVDRFPSYIVKVLWWNPMLQIIELSRSSVCDGYRSIQTSIPYLVIVLMCSLCLGMLFERHIRIRGGR